MMSMNIVIVTWDYPNKKRNVFPFVKNLVVEWAKQGHTCTVIAPYSIINGKGLYKKNTIEIDDGASVEVIRPNYLSLSNFHLLGFNFTAFFHKNAVNRALLSLRVKPDFIYCHFWISATEVLDYANKIKLPVFVATGESIIRDEMSKYADSFRQVVKGVIAVSSENRDDSIIKGLVSPKDIKVFPNAIDTNLFRQYGREECRNKLGVESDIFIIVFVGWFNERKGAWRVAEALKDIDGERIFSFFIGSGNIEPECPNILFKGKLKHSEIPDYLNAADVFVLPTLHEGCSNAIVEAMACGLPIISSDLPFNKDICDESNSILINPNDINAIKQAILFLRDNKKMRLKMSQGSLNRSAFLTIDKRATDIIDFIKEKL